VRFAGYNIEQMEYECDGYRSFDSVSTNASAEKNDALVLKDRRELNRRWSDGMQESQEIELKTSWSICDSTKIRNVSQVYQCTKVLGKGTTSNVYKASLRAVPQHLFAIKSIKKSNFTSTGLDYIKGEVEILKKLDHPNIAKFYECYDDNTLLNIVMEYCEGADLATYLENQGKLPNELAKRLFFDALLAVNHLHSFGYSHRDIKLDNFLLSSNDINIALLKLIDFGFSKSWRASKLKSLVGSAWYVAPEVIDASKEGYTMACDCWSLGVMLYIMIMGKPPFTGKNNSEIFKNIKEQEIDFSSSKFSKVEPEAISLIKSLLCKDQRQRATVRDALLSPWFNSVLLNLHKGFDKSKAYEVVESLYKASSIPKTIQEIKKTMVRLFGNSADAKQTENLFLCCDFIDNGILTEVEAERLMNKAGLEYSKEKWSNILLGLDSDSKGYLTYTEFMAAVLPPTFFLEEKRLKFIITKLESMFKELGSEEENIVSCIDSFSSCIAISTVKQLIADFDIYKDGVISYEEFVKVMKKD